MTSQYLGNVKINDSFDENSVTAEAIKKSLGQTVTKAEVSDGALRIYFNNQNILRLTDEGQD